MLMKRVASIRRNVLAESGPPPQKGWITMIITSAVFSDNEEIAQKYGKKQENVSPPLSWEGAPPTTKSYAVSVVDRHPVARGYVHWFVANLDPATTSLVEGASGGGMPAGSREITRYAGPFPPSGTHDYEFTVYALDTETLDVPNEIASSALVDVVRPHVLDSATLTARFTKVGIA